MPVNFFAYHDRTSAQQKQIVDELAAQGFRFVSLSIYGKPSDPRYAGVMVLRPVVIAQDTRFNLTTAQFQAAFDECASKGFAPAIITATGPATNPLFAVVFDPAPGFIPRTVVNADRARFDAEMAAARKENTSLRWAAMYGSGGDRRFAGVWWPHPPGIPWNAVVDLNAAQDQQVFDALTAVGARPAFTTVSADGRFLTVYRDDSIGPTPTLGATSSAGYQAEFEKQTKAGFFPICVQAGGHTGGSALFTAVFAQQEEIIPRQFTVTGPAIAEMAPLDDLMRLGMQKSGTRGAAVAVARNGRLAYARGYTWAEPGYPIVEPEDLFRVASCSKALTAIATHQLFEQGSLTAETLVQPLLQLQPPPGMSFTKIGGVACIDEIRVKHLLSHTSGLPHADVAQSTVAAAYGHGGAPTKRETVSHALCQPMLFRPGGPIPANTDNYSNVAYVLLGLVIAEITGMEYDRAVQKLLFDRLGISHAAIGKSTLAQRRNREVMYHSKTLAVGPSALVPPPQPLIAEQYGVGGDMPVGDAAGGWIISAVDFAQILAALHADPSNPVFTKSGTRQKQWDCGLWEGPVPFNNALDKNGNSVVSRPKGGGFSGTNALVMHRDDGTSIAIFLNSDFWPADTEMSISSPPVDGSWLNFQVNERLNVITEWPKIPFPPFQVWELLTNGFPCELWIDALDAKGNVTGRILDGNRTDPVRGLWNGPARKLTFTRDIGAGASGTQVYTGYLLDGQETLAGTFEAFAGSGATARTGVFGWKASARRPTVELHL